MTEQQNKEYLNVNGVKIVGDNNEHAVEEAKKVIPGARVSGTNMKASSAGYECSDGTQVDLVQFYSGNDLAMSFAGITKGEQRMCCIVPEGGYPRIKFYKGDESFYEADADKMPKENKAKIAGVLEQYVPKGKHWQPLKFDENLPEFIAGGIKEVNAAVHDYDAQRRAEKKQEAFNNAFAQFTSGLLDR